MMEDKNKRNLTEKDFQRVHVASEEAEKIAAKRMSFWEDAWRRLRQDKAAILSFWIIALLVLFSIILPNKPFNQTDMNGDAFSYKASPRVLNEEGQEIYKGDIQYLPPRIPGFDKLGIFDGYAKAEISIFDIIVGRLPKTDKWLELQKPLNRKKLVEELGIPYHPFDIIIHNIYDDNGVKMMDYEVVATGERVVDEYEKYISEYSKYRPELFEFISSTVDDFGSNMIRVNRDLYGMQHVKDQYFWFGTDQISLDNWTRLWVGIRVSLLLALCVMIFNFSIGITYGTISGFYAGTWIDNLMMRIAEILGSIPFFVFLFIFISIKTKIFAFLNKVAYHVISAHVYFWILGIAFVVMVARLIYRYSKKYIDGDDIKRRVKDFAIFFAIYGVIHLGVYFLVRSFVAVDENMLNRNAQSFIIIVMALSITGWIGVTRLVRAQIIKLRDQEFVLAARTLGASNTRIMRKHLFPNIIGQLVVLLTFMIPSAIFSEAFLTFLGLGLPQPLSSLGVLVFNGYESIKTQPTMLIIPAFFMSLLMLAINLLANGLRDALDPRMR